MNSGLKIIAKSCDRLKIFACHHFFSILMCDQNFMLMAHFMLIDDTPPAKTLVL